MKKAIMALAAAGSLLASCTNESIAFDDFERQTIYMPYQYPVRTLSLGNDRIDNSLDRQHKFNMGVCVGGYYNGSISKSTPRWCPTISTAATRRWRRCPRSITCSRRRPARSSPRGRSAV